MSDEKNSRVTKSERYVINGKEYHSLDEIPEAERKKLDASLKLLATLKGSAKSIPDDGAQTTYVDTKEVRTSSGDSEKANNLIQDVLRNLDANRFDLSGQKQEQKTQNIISFPPDQNQEKQGSNTMKYYIVILALIGVIVYLLLKPHS